MHPPTLCEPLAGPVLHSCMPNNGYFHVIAMDLNARYLDGTIPDSRFNLTQLHGINLASNQIRGDRCPAQLPCWRAFA